MVMVFVLEGDVSSFTDQILSSMQQSMATKLGVDGNSVQVTVEAGSVKLTVEVSYPSAQVAGDAKAIMESTTLASTTTAAQFIAVPGISVTVTAIEPIRTEQVSQSDEGGFLGLDTSTLIIIAAGGAAAIVLAVGLAICMCRRNGSKRSHDIKV